MCFFVVNSFETWFRVQSVIINMFVVPREQGSFL
jgi:hypothetical protein